MIFLGGIILGAAVIVYLVIQILFPAVSRRKAALAVGAAGLLVCVVLLIMVENATHTMPQGARLLSPGEKVSDIKLPP